MRVEIVCNGKDKIYLTEGTWVRSDFVDKLQKENAELKRAISEYQRELQNPAPDALYRKVLRDRMFNLIGGPRGEEKD